jgi:hypothetical protein
VVLNEFSICGLGEVNFYLIAGREYNMINNGVFLSWFFDFKNSS